MAEFSIHVFTSNIKGASADSGIEMNIVGDLGETGFQKLLPRTDSFERGKV